MGDYDAAFDAAEVLTAAGIRQTQCPHGLYLWDGLQFCGSDHPHAYEME